MAVRVLQLVQTLCTQSRVLAVKWVSCTSCVLDIIPADNHSVQMALPCTIHPQKYLLFQEVRLLVVGAQVHPLL